MPFNYVDYYFTSVTSSEYNSAAVKWNISGPVNYPTARDVLLRFQAVYPTWDGNMYDAWDYCQGSGVVRYDDGLGYTYWQLVQGNVPITDFVFNGTALKKYIQGATTVFEKATATFTGLTGASPSSYSAQTVRVDLSEQVVSPGSPTKSGFTFTGWSPSLPRTISVDTVFTAQWQAAESWASCSVYASANYANNSMALNDDSYRAGLNSAVASDYLDYSLGGTKTSGTVYVKTEAKYNYSYIDSSSNYSLGTTGTRMITVWGWTGSAWTLLGNNYKYSDSDRETSTFSYSGAGISRIKVQITLYGEGDMAYGHSLASGESYYAEIYFFGFYGS